MNFRSSQLTFFDRLGSKYPIEKRTYLRASTDGGGVEKFYLNGNQLDTEADGSLVLDFRGQKIPLRAAPWPEDVHESQTSEDKVEEDQAWIDIPKTLEGESDA